MRNARILTGVILAVSLVGCGQERLSYRVPPEHARAGNIRIITKELSAIYGVKRVEIQESEAGNTVILTCDPDSTAVVSEKAAHLGLVNQQKEKL
jgi:hypothetical protein